MFDWCETLFEQCSQGHHVVIGHPCGFLPVTDQKSLVLFHTVTVVVTTVPLHLKWWITKQITCISLKRNGGKWYMRQNDHGTTIQAISFSKGKQSPSQAHSDRPRHPFQNKKGTQAMRIPRHFTFLASLLLAASLLIVFTSGESTAFAATKQVSGRAATMQSTRVPSVNRCDNKSSRVVAKDLFGIELLYFRMSTHWCWNFKIVTYHSTTAVATVTGPGATVGWRITNVSSIHFECYVAAGSKLQCSGNREQATADFQNRFTGQRCHASITQAQNYKGQFFASGSMKC
jgi:hypothetical protein